MAENSGISWCDHTFNPWMGCTKVSPACKFCYAERDFDHRHGKVAWGPSGTRVLTSDRNWKNPLKWNREAELYAWGADRVGKPQRRPRVFCASLADVFEDWQGPIHDSHENQMHIGGPDGPGRDMTMNDLRQRLFALIDATPNLDWLLLTKRPENIKRMMPYRDGSPPPAHDGRWRPNVWLGTSVENQEYADKRIPELLKCRDLSPVLFLSCEPLVGPVCLDELVYCQDCYGTRLMNDGPQGLERACDKCAGETLIDWVIAGGESGPSARPSHPEWFRSLRDQASEAGVPFHFKQWGEWVPGDHDCVTFSDNEVLPWHDKEGSDITPMCRVGKARAGRMLDGVLHDAFPSEAAS